MSKSGNKSVSKSKEITIGVLVKLKTISFFSRSREKTEKLGGVAFLLY